jgi:hypothetical protein
MPLEAPVMTITCCAIGFNVRFMRVLPARQLPAWWPTRQINGA